MPKLSDRAWRKPTEDMREFTVSLSRSKYQWDYRAEQQRKEEQEWREAPSVKGALDALSRHVSVHHQDKTEALLQL